mmetsp:Transcript_40390/g.127115  ORF Transcript_40390/g.127115 Transcript_40390/m.127115 type:complete len:234 (-) Transcript_40390:445-1146(-)
MLKALRCRCTHSPSRSFPIRKSRGTLLCPFAPRNSRNKLIILSQQQDRFLTLQKSSPRFISTSCLSCDSFPFLFFRICLRNHLIKFHSVTASELGLLAAWMRLSKFEFHLCNRRSLTNPMDRSHLLLLSEIRCFFILLLCSLTHLPRLALFWQKSEGTWLWPKFCAKRTRSLKEEYQPFSSAFQTNPISFNIFSLSASSRSDRFILLCKSTHNASVLYLLDLFGTQQCPCTCL